MAKKKEQRSSVAIRSEMGAIAAKIFDTVVVASKVALSDGQPEPKVVEIQRILGPVPELCEKMQPLDLELDEAIRYEALHPTEKSIPPRELTKEEVEQIKNR